MTNTNREVLNKIAELYQTLYEHDGFGELKIEMRILKRNQKEVVVHCGCQHRYVVDWKNADPSWTEKKSSVSPCAECQAENNKQSVSARHI